MRHPMRRTHLHQLCMRWKRRGVGCWHAEPPVESADCGAESSAKPRKDASKIFKRRIGTSGHSPEGYASGNFERASLRVVMKPYENTVKENLELGRAFHLGHS